MRASGTMRGSAVRNPRTSFQSVTSFAARTRAMTVAVKSEPPRPSVTTEFSLPAPMNPGTTAISPRAKIGKKSGNAPISVRARSGAASLKRPSVCRKSAASTTVAEPPETRRAHATICAAMRSPREMIASLIRADNVCS